MQRLAQSFVALFLLLLCVAAGGLWFLYRESDPGVRPGANELVLPTLPDMAPPARIVESAAPRTEELPRLRPFVWPEGAVRNELVFSFANREDMERFLREARRHGLTNLNSIPALGVVRVRTANDAEVRRALGLAGDAVASLNPYVSAPDVPPLEGAGGRYLPFGDHALDWMGVPEDNSGWGSGVRVAILDTGVGDHPSLDHASITRISMLGADATVGTHGTAVASLLVGQGEVRGIAPAADVLSIQVLDADGSGNAFDLARGIMAAVDAGAQIINLSLGGDESPFLRDAILYARQRDVLIVASAGNDGAGRLLYPAADDGVVALGSVDGNGRHVPFSNRGDNLLVAGPGYGLHAAGPDGTVAIVSGTSFTASYVSGSLARLLETMPAADALQVLEENTNEAGPPGRDPYYGAGIIDWERIAWAGQPGIYDLAVAGHYLKMNQGSPEMLINVQNQGTEAVGNIALEIVVNGMPHTVWLGTLEAGDVGTGRIALGEFLGRSEEIEVFSRVTAPGLTDLRPDNNFKNVSLRFQDP